MTKSVYRPQNYDPLLCKNSWQNGQATALNYTRAKSSQTQLWTYSRAVGTGGTGGQSTPSNILADQLTLFKRGRQIMPTTLLLPQPDFQTFLRPCIVSASCDLCKVSLYRFLWWWAPATPCMFFLTFFWQLLRKNMAAYWKRSWPYTWSLSSIFYHHH